ncbi:hypothetical protein J9303_04460 [Bacillaceae bacterium Marseille-Q3522]|nr:hypothetical protein [Bacillaceae bacterium Marseille-Q3522]
MNKKIALAIPLIIGAVGLGSICLLLARIFHFSDKSGITIQTVLIEKRVLLSLLQSFLISVISAILAIAVGVWIVRKLAFRMKYSTTYRGRNRNNARRLRLKYSAAYMERRKTGLQYLLPIRIKSSSLYRNYNNCELRESDLWQRVWNSSFYYPHFTVAFYIYFIFSFLYPYIGGYQTIYGPFEIITSYFLKEVPFVVFYLYPTYQKISADEIDMYLLFCKERKSGMWRTLEWPKTAPQLSELMLILVAFIWTAYEVPGIVGNSYPEFVSVLIYNQYLDTDPGSRLQSFVLMLVVTCTLLFMAVVLFVATWRYRRHIFQGSDQS